MPTRQVSFTDPALEDIRLIRNYTVQQWGANQADTYTRSLMNSIELLSSSPERGWLVSPSRPGLRRIIVRPHIIYYRILEEKIEILRVLHEAADQFLDFD